MLHTEIHITYWKSKISLILSGVIVISEQFFNYIMTRTSYIRWDDDDVPFVNDLHTYWEFYSATSTQTNHPDSEPTSLYSYSLILCA